MTRPKSIDGSHVTWYGVPTGHTGQLGPGRGIFMIDVLDILAKNKVHPLAPATLRDFTCSEMGKVDPAVTIYDPTISLYCFDHDSEHAIFVQVPHDVDITLGPFLYLEQYEHAQRILAVPYEVFHRLAASIDARAPLVFIHSTGRAGSTLLSKAFGDMESVTSLSEPDVYTQAVSMRLSGVQDDEICRLLSSATKILFNPAFAGNTSLHVVKFRSFCIEVADLLSAALPDAGSLFLWRNLGAYIHSSMRAFGVDDMSPEVGRAALASLAGTAPLLDEELRQRSELDRVEVLCLIWLSAMHTYARFNQQGIPMLAMRYDELVAEPLRMMETILAYLGLPTDRLSGSLRAFERDSQSGSMVSRDAAARRRVNIDGRRWDLVHSLLRRYPIAVPDLAVANPGLL